MNLLLVCLKIFFARIADVSLGTLRMLLTVKEKKFLAMIAAFFEVTIWFLVAREALNEAQQSIFVVLAYAGGFAVGTFVGSIISSRVITGNLKVQVITKYNEDIIDTIKKEGFGVSGIPTHDKKLMLILEINKKDYNKLKKLIYTIDDRAFISVNETKYIENGFFLKK